MSFKAHKRKLPNPRAIKKHSHIVAAAKSANNLVGLRTPTETGYTVAGASCSAFNTHTEIFLPHTASDKLMHAKKYRAYSVISGKGIIVLNEEVFKLAPGVTMLVDPGVAYRVVTMGNDELRLLVTQPPKYEARLTVVEKCAVSVDAPEGSLRPISMEEAATAAFPRRRLNGSKAKEQMSTLSSTQKRQESAGASTPNVVEVNQQPMKIVNGELVG